MTRLSRSRSSHRMESVLFNSNWPLKDREIFRKSSRLREPSVIWRLHAIHILKQILDQVEKGITGAVDDI